MTEPDPAVVRAAQAGDLRAFDELVRSCYAPVLRYLRHLLADHALAEDIAQEAFVRCYRNIGRYQFEGRFTTWLVQIARNAAIDAMRQRDRRARLLRMAPRPAVQSDPSAGVELDAALRSLPSRLGDALLLVEVVALRYREAAAVLGVPEGTVKSRVSHARARLLDWYTHEEDEVDDALR